MTYLWPGLAGPVVLILSRCSRITWFRFNISIQIAWRSDSDDIECKLCEVTFSVRVLLEKSSGSWWSLAASVLSSKTSCVFVTVFALAFVFVFVFLFVWRREKFWQLAEPCCISSVQQNILCICICICICICFYICFCIFLLLLLHLSLYMFLYFCFYICVCICVKRKTLAGGRVLL